MEPLPLPHFETNEATLMAPDDPSVITIYTLNFQLAQTPTSSPILKSNFIQRNLHPRSVALNPVCYSIQNLILKPSSLTNSFHEASYPFTGLERSLGLQEFEAERISRQSALKGGKVVTGHLYPRRHPCCSFL